MYHFDVWFQFTVHYCCLYIPKRHHWQTSVALLKARPKMVLVMLAKTYSFSLLIVLVVMYRIFMDRLAFAWLIHCHWPCHIGTFRVQNRAKVKESVALAPKRCGQWGLWNNKCNSRQIYIWRMQIVARQSCVTAISATKPISFNETVDVVFYVRLIHVTNVDQGSTVPMLHVHPWNKIQ